MSRWKQGTLDHDGDGQMGGSLPHKQKENNMAKQEQAVAVNQGATYEANEGGERVVAFFVDRPRSRVKFAPLGSGREDATDVETFLRDYTLVAQEGEALPEIKEENDRLNKEADGNVESAPNTGARTDTIDTASGTPTRAATEERNAKRNSKK